MLMIIVFIMQPLFLDPLVSAPLAALLKHDRWLTQLVDALGGPLNLVLPRQVAENAESFRQVLNDPYFGVILGGGHKPDSDRKDIFATIQTISKNKIYSIYSTNAFDYIVIDEFHHSAAASYKKILRYFNPKVILLRPCGAWMNCVLNPRASPEAIGMRISGAYILLTPHHCL